MLQSSTTTSKKERRCLDFTACLQPATLSPLMNTMPKWDWPATLMLVRLSSRCPHSCYSKVGPNSWTTTRLFICCGCWSLRTMLLSQVLKGASRGRSWFSRHERCCSHLLAAGGTLLSEPAIAFVIKNMFGLICDPVAGLLSSMRCCTHGSQLCLSSQLIWP